MKKTVLLLLALLVLLAGCEKRQSALTPSASVSDAQSSQPEDPASESPAQEDDSASDADESALSDDEANAAAEKYYDYFMKNPHVGLLLDNETGGNGFSDAEMSAFALMELIMQSNGGYDSAVGFPRADIDAVTQKYFGTTIGNYDNQKATIIPETGNITATGWGSGMAAFVLRDLGRGADGAFSGEFYTIGFGMEGVPSTAKADLLRGDFEGYGQPYLVTIIFEEKTDDSGELYLRYRLAKAGGKAAAPYDVYAGKA